MTRAKDISKIVSDANFGGTLDVVGKITADAGVDIDNITIDGTTIALSSGDLTLDVSGDITLDADGGDIFLKDGGTQFGVLSNDAGYFDIKSTVSNQDISFKGNDGGATITALRLDMSDAGRAVFNAGLSIGGTGTANTLDDYEEGTWTATLIGSGSNPSTPVTATCHYTKIGQTVYVNGQLSNFNNTGATGAVRITGIPFTANPGSQATGNVMIQNAASWGGTNTANISPYFTPSYIGFYGSQSAGGWFEISHNVSAGCYISFSGIYKV